MISTAYEGFVLSPVVCRCGMCFYYSSVKYLIVLRINIVITLLKFRHAGIVSN
jgi:hypothetical protein